MTQSTDSIRFSLVPVPGRQQYDLQIEVSDGLLLYFPKEPRGPVMVPTITVRVPSDSSVGVRHAQQGIDIQSFPTELGLGDLADGPVGLTVQFRKPGLVHGTTTTLSWGEVFVHQVSPGPLPETRGRMGVGMKMHLLGDGTPLVELMGLGRLALCWHGRWGALKRVQHLFMVVPDGCYARVFRQAPEGSCQHNLTVDTAENAPVIFGYPSGPQGEPLQIRFFSEDRNTLDACVDVEVVELSREHIAPDTAPAAEPPRPVASPDRRPTLTNIELGSPSPDPPPESSQVTRLTNDSGVPAPGPEPQPTWDLQPVSEGQPPLLSGAAEALPSPPAGTASPGPLAVSKLQIDEARTGQIRVSGRSTMSEEATLVPFQDDALSLALERIAQGQETILASLHAAVKRIDENSRQVYLLQARLDEISGFMSRQGRLENALDPRSSAAAQQVETQAGRLGPTELTSVADPVLVGQLEQLIDQLAEAERSKRDERADLDTLQRLTDALTGLCPRLNELDPSLAGEGERLRLTVASAARGDAPFDRARILLEAGETAAAVASMRSRLFEGGADALSLPRLVARLKMLIRTLWPHGSFKVMRSEVEDCLTAVSLELIEPIENSEWRPWEQEVQHRRSPANGIPRDSVLEVHQPGFRHAGKVVDKAVVTLASP